MITLVQNLASYAHAKDPNFKIWVNASGAEDLLLNSAFVVVIDGAYEENLFYQDNGQPQPLTETAFNLGLLGNLLRAGKPVVAIEYVTGATAVADVEAKAAAAGIGYYVANPDLELNGVDTEGFNAPICFLRGTRIATPSGEVAVERLVVGDDVLTFDGKSEPIIWIGVSRALAAAGRRGATTPVIVREGALAHNMPHRDLHLTKGHSLFIDAALIPVEFLVNYRSIVWDHRPREIEIYHIELARHGVLLAEGAPAESYRDDGNRELFLKGNGEQGARPAAQPPCAPVLTGGPVVDEIWRRILDRAAPSPAVPMTNEPDLHLLVDGQRINPRARHGDRHTFRLPARPANVRIVSHSCVPAELGTARDPRCLGVAVRRIVIWQGRSLKLVEAADPALSDGFHTYEPDNGYRWTNGEGMLPASWFAARDGTLELELHIGCVALYPGAGGRADLSLRDFR